jgi:hypothetical protein
MPVSPWVQVTGERYVEAICRPRRAADCCRMRVGSRPSRRARRVRESLRRSVGVAGQADGGGMPRALMAQEPGSSRWAVPWSEGHIPGRVGLGVSARGNSPTSVAHGDRLRLVERLGCARQLCLLGQHPGLAPADAGVDRAVLARRGGDCVHQPRPFPAPAGPVVPVQLGEDDSTSMPERASISRNKMFSACVMITNKGTWSGLGTATSSFGGGPVDRRR